MVGVLAEWWVRQLYNRYEQVEVDFIRGDAAVQWEFEAGRNKVLIRLNRYCRGQFY